MQILFKEHTMKKVEYADGKEKVSAACLGTMMMGTRIDKPNSFKILDDFTARGGNFVDTANCYSWWWGDEHSFGDDSENLLGEWMSERNNRNDVFLATKFGGRITHPEKLRDEKGEIMWDKVPADYEGSSAKVIRTAIEGSLKRLNTDHIDLYYVHVDDRSVSFEETLYSLSKLVQEGKVRYIGCSNIRSWRLSNAREISRQNGLPLFTAVQQEFSYIRPNFGVDRGVTTHVDDDLIDYLKANDDMTLLAYSPLLKGVYVSEEKRKNYYHWNFFNSGESLERIAVIDKLSKDTGISGNKLVLAWIMRQKPRMIPLIGCSNFEQYLENVESFDVELTDSQMALLEKGKL